MFCKNCGKEIKDDSIFCPSCGEKIREISSNEAEGQVNANALSDSQVLRKYGYSSVAKISFVFSIICFVVVLIFSLIFYVDGIARGDDFQKNYSLFLFVLLVIYMFIVSVQYSTLSKMSLYICTDKLYGTARKFSYFTTQKFEVSYSDILDVKCEGLLRGPLVIETKMATYKCFIGKKQDAKEQIQNQISSLKN